MPWRRLLDVSPLLSIMVCWLPLLDASCRGGWSKPLARVFPAELSPVSDEIMNGVWCSAVVCEHGDDLLLPSTVLASPPVLYQAKMLASVSIRKNGRGTAIPLPRRWRDTVLARRLCPDLIIQPQPLSDENPFWSTN